MSVIFGKFNFDNRPLDAADLPKMQTALNHWQADHAHTLTDGAAGMGHLMLYNTPQSAFEQLPLRHSASRLTITADARLDNRQELATRLGLTQYPIQEIPDGFLILQSYLKYGTRCTEHLIGDFAFAIYDAGNQQLFCARDHLGVKPFFYYQDAHYFAFASEKKGLLALDDADRSLNLQYFFNHVIYPTEQATDTTLYARINRLKPGHRMVIHLPTKNNHSERYWEANVINVLQLKDKREYYEGFRHHFEQAVQCRLVSKYTIGAQLSGGMDSSAITGYAHTYLQGRKPGFTTLSNTLGSDVIDPDIKKLDERRYIDEVNQHWDIQNPIYITRPLFDSVFEELRFANYLNDGLERWSPNWLLPLKAAAKDQGIRTLLSGFPGDELVTYRGKYYFLDHLDKRHYLKYILSPKKQSKLSKWEPLLPFGLKRAVNRAKYALQLHPSKLKQNFEVYNYPTHYQQHLRDGFWLDPYFQERFKSYRHFQRYRILKPQVTHRMESETRYGIHFRTEPRFPMADIRLIQFYLSMPNELKYEGEQSRTAYRKAVVPYLPPAILQRDDKYGSVAPFIKSRGRLTPQETKTLIEQLPDWPVLKKAQYLEVVNSPLFSSKKLHTQLPFADVLVWLTENRDWLNTL